MLTPKCWLNFLPLLIKKLDIKITRLLPDKWNDGIVFLDNLLPLGKVDNSHLNNHAWVTSWTILCWWSLLSDGLFLSNNIGNASNRQTTGGPSAK